MVPARDERDVAPQICDEPSNKGDRFIFPKKGDRFIFSRFCAKSPNTRENKSVPFFRENKSVPFLLFVAVPFLVGDQAIAGAGRGLQDFGRGGIALEFLAQAVHELLQQLAVARATMAPDMQQQ